MKRLIKTSRRININSVVRKMTEKPTVEWFSAREIAITASFGGLVFASVLLGLVIPIAPGGIVVWVLEGLIAPASCTAGPIGAWLIYFLAGCARPFSLWIWVVHGPINAAGLSVLYYFFKDMGLKKRLSIFYVINLILWVIANLPATWFCVYFYRFVPPEAFWEFFWTLMITFSLPEALMYSIFMTVTLIIFPSFVKPEWWGRWKEGLRLRREYEKRKVSEAPRK